MISLNFVKKMKLSNIIVFLTLVLLSSCGRDPKKPGRIFIPDMAYSPGYETYAESPIPTPEGHLMSARLPVQGTIPRGAIPDDEKIKTNQAYLMSYLAKNYFTHKEEKWEEEYAKAAAMLQNPLEPTKENIARGKELYTIHCQVCHGEKGEGNGQIVVLPDGSDGPYTAVPPAYSKRLPEIKDGNMFYSISYGKGMMGGYGFALNVTERWQLILYIKTLAGLNVSGQASNDLNKTNEPKKSM
ncbi:MAG: cytochrome c [Chitinophagales bacterium]|nr:cytochrome c [Chitinophagales bacterium]MDW8272627.1 cytochrome c [Chitinophagales bacterium]